LPDYCDIYFQETNKLIVGSDKIKNVERETWQMVYDFWESRHISMLDEERSYLRDQFVDFINEYDKRRNKDFSQIFPEFNDWD
jgi:predicted transcriptional regulator